MIAPRALDGLMRADSDKSRAWQLFSLCLVSHMMRVSHALQMRKPASDTGLCKVHAGHAKKGASGEADVAGAAASADEAATGGEDRRAVADGAAAAAGAGAAAAAAGGGGAALGELRLLAPAAAETRAPESPAAAALEAEVDEQRSLAPFSAGGFAFAALTEGGTAAG